MFALREQDQIGDLLETLITVFQNEKLLERILRAPSSRMVYALLYEAIREQDR
jgi:mannitol/fructose-specific phosphotransferase system IIA component (Ntr-type)